MIKGKDHYQFLLVVVLAILVKASSYSLLPMTLLVYQLYKVFVASDQFTSYGKSIRDIKENELSHRITTRFDIASAIVGCTILWRMGIISSSANISALVSLLLVLAYIRLEICLDIVFRLVLIQIVLIAILYSPRNLTTVENLSTILFFQLAYISLATIKSTLTSNNS